MVVKNGFLSNIRCILSIMAFITKEGRELKRRREEKSREENDGVKAREDGESEPSQFIFFQQPNERDRCCLEVIIRMSFEAEEDFCPQHICTTEGKLPR